MHLTCIEGFHVISEFGRVDFHTTCSYCVVMRGVFEFVGDTTVVNEPLHVAEVETIAVGTSDSAD
jgi:hypothetical protein